MAPNAPGHDLKLAAILPPLFICCVVGTVWSTYTCLHLMPMLQLGKPSETADLDTAKRGMMQMITAQALFSLFITCYTRAILTPPGSIPNTDEWRYTRTEGSRPVTIEVKESGERRHCKWCMKYKPDRCHHCRVCKTCVLRMDHHCPWIMNCVGWGNHKYFLLTVFYAAASCLYICATVFESVVASTHQDMPHTNRFLLVLCNVLSGFFAFLMTGFLGFHIYLTANAVTTIEFCEKATSPKPGPNPKVPNYDLGLYENFAVALGPRPLLWLMPIDPGRGDGIHFHFGRKSAVEEPVNADPEWTSAALPGSLTAALQG